MLRAFSLGSLGFAILVLSSCVVDDNSNFDFEDQNFYYGCAKQTDCVNPDDDVAYVCCYDKLKRGDSVCGGRCVPSIECPATFDDSGQVCSDLGIN